MERLDKFLCDSGAGTRSQVKLILKAGRVTVDGKPEKDGSRKIDPAKNEVMLDGSALRGQRKVREMHRPDRRKAGACLRLYGFMGRDRPRNRSQDPRPDTH